MSKIEKSTKLSTLLAAIINLLCLNFTLDFLTNSFLFCFAVVSSIILVRQDKYMNSTRAIISNSKNSNKYLSEFYVERGFSFTFSITFGQTFGLVYFLINGPAECIFYYPLLISVCNCITIFINEKSFNEFELTT